ncbi:MAG: hypothetical protein IJ196_05775 [Prevotella sp.]|nr:hypothetical protein [Prevotella sp.]
MTSSTHIARWLDGIAYEVAFWNNVYRWKRTFNGLLAWSHYGSNIELEGFDANGFLATHDAPKVLDVGAGMSYAPGDHIVKDGISQPLDIHYVDPLAMFFNQILQRHHRELPAIEFGMMEYLSAFYEEGSVSMVVIQNALDHSAAPMKGIFEALYTLETGGILYLNHHPNEAEVENYKGFHQYNIIAENGRLTIWNRDEHMDVAAMLEGFAVIDQALQVENGHVIAVIRKTNRVPDELLQNREDKRLLCEELLSQAQNHQRLGYDVKKKITYWKYNAIQLVAQALPWTLKMRLKHLLTGK